MKPWRYRQITGSPGKFDVYEGHNSQAILRVGTFNAVMTDEDHGRARLIAAAPALRSVLQEAVNDGFLPGEILDRVEDLLLLTETPWKE